PTTGAACGFAAGLLLDLAPPATATLGISSLILTVIGYALGRVFDSDTRPLVLTTLLTSGAAALSILAGAALGGLLGTPRIVWGDVPVMILTAALYAAILALLVIPVVNRLSRAFVPEAYPR
ncbi:MAG: rod shape-determining protein MreD, partial [Actinomycetota bacterium]